MSNFPAYTTKTFSPTQKFFVLDPNTGNPAFVQGSDLVSQLTPNSKYVYSESTRTTAQATDYKRGSVIQTSGATSVGDNQAGVYVVVAPGEGDFPMDNGDELLTLAGDDTLREQLALNTAGDGSDLVAHTGTTNTVTEALDQHTADINQRTIYVGSVAELRASSGLSGDVYVQGYYSKDDKGGGHFFPDLADTTTADDGGSVIIDSENVRWKRKFSNYLNSHMFGATSGGVADETAKHRAGIAALSAGSGGTYEIFGKTLISDIEDDLGGLIGYCIDVPSNITIKGAEGIEIVGDKAIGPTDGYAIFQVRSTSNIKLQDLYLNGEDKTTAGGIGVGVIIRFKDAAADPTATNITFDGLSCDNLRTSLITSQLSTSSPELLFNAVNVLTQNCHARDCGGHGIAFRGIKNLTIDKNIAENCGENTTRPVGFLGIDTSSGCFNAKMTNNRIINCGGGFKFEADYSADPDFHGEHNIAANNTVIGGALAYDYGARISSNKTIVCNNIITGHKGQGIDMSTNPGAAESMLVIDNIVTGITANFDGDASPFKITTNLAAASEPEIVNRDMVVISGNTFEDFDGDGIVKSSGVTLKNNIFKNSSAFAVRVFNDETPFNVTDYVYSDLEITGNSFINCRGIRFEGPADVSATGSNIFVSNNKYRDCTSPLLKISKYRNVSLSGNNASGTIGTSNAIQFDDCDDVLVAGSNLSTESSANNIVTANCDFFIITDNIISGGGDAIITINASTKAIVSNNIETGTTGYTLDASNTVANNL